MGQLEIVEKLGRLLDNKLPFTEESEVVYLLVEIRKLLDRENNNKYPLLRFYADWSVHTAKDLITKEMRSIMTEIYSDVSEEITSSPLPIAKKTKIISFIYMEDLQAEMQSFLKEYDLPDSLTNDQNNWIKSIILLVQILADQPIIKPCDEIVRFAFFPAAEGSVRGEINFTNSIRSATGEYNHYSFGNVY